MYCTNCGINLQEKWIYCAQCGTKRTTIDTVNQKENPKTFQEFITKFSKEHNISEEEAKELAIKVLTK